MAFDYEFGELEDEIIETCTRLPIDIGKIEKLIELGADINKEVSDRNSDGNINVLSESIIEFPEPDYDVFNTNPRSPKVVAQRKEESLYRKTELTKLIDCFLAHGFDLTKQNNSYGDACLCSLDYIRYEDFKLEAAKKLLDSGAKVLERDCESTLGVVGTHAYYSSCMEGLPEYGNLHNAMYVLLENSMKNKPYHGIQNYIYAIGRSIEAIYALNLRNGAADGIFFRRDNIDNCFNCDLCFKLNGAWLYLSRDMELHVDTEKPTEEFTDVSNHFAEAVGAKIEAVRFGRYDYGHCPSDALAFKLSKSAEQKMIGFSYTVGLPQIRDKTGHLVPDFSKYYAYVVRK